LDDPLEGPVYLRSNPENTSGLPDLVAALNGQIDVELVGKISQGAGGGLKSTFASAPDAPVSKFVLEMFGGNRSLLVLSENICGPRAKTKALSDLTAQNGKLYDTTPKLQTSCKHGKHKKRQRGGR
jgi:hypothetical protein